MFAHKTIAAQEQVRGIVMNYVGMPAASFNSFQRDSGLAQLIAVMRSHGTPVKVIDLASTDIIRRLRPPFMQRQLKGIWSALQNAIGAGRGPSLLTVIKLFGLDLLSYFYQRTFERRIARELIEEIEAVRPSFFAAKLWMGDGFKGSMRIIRDIHRHFPGLPIVVGGPLTVPAGQEILEHYPSVTYVIRGEADISLPYLQEVLQGKRLHGTVPNLLYRYPDGAIGQTPGLFVSDLRSFVMPAISSDLYHVRGEREGLRTVTIDSGRGCNNQCLYCVVPVHQGGRRERTPQQIVDQMVDAYREQAVRYFRLGGPNTSPELLEGIATELLKRGLSGFTWTAFTDIVDIKEDVIRKASRAGLAALFLGIESTDHGFQRVFTPRKYVPYAKIVESVLMMKRYGLFVTGSFIVGYPGETDLAWAENKRLIKECLFDSVLLNPFAVFPEAKVFSKKVPGITKSVSDRTYRRMLMHFKVNLLLPFLMRPLPYTIDGRRMKDIVALMISRQQELESEGITVGIDGDLGVIAGMLGLPARDLVAASKEMFFTGDAEEIERTIELINAVIENGPLRPR